MRHYFTSFVGQVRKPGLVRDLAAGGMGNIGLKVLQVLLAVALSATLARSLGPSGYGIYAYAFTLVNVLIIPSQFGLTKLIIRETAQGEADGDNNVIRGIWTWSTLIGTLATATICALALIALYVFGGQLTEEMRLTCLFGVALLATMTASRLVGAALRGLRRVVLGQLSEMLVRPGLLLCLVLFLVWQGEIQLGPARAMELHIVAAGVSLLTGVILLISTRPAGLSVSLACTFRHRNWLAAAIPFIWISATYQILQYADILMIGMFRSAEEVGVYRVAVQAALLGIIGLQAIQRLVQPYLARFYGQGDKKKLNWLLTVTSRGAFLISLGVWLILVIAGRSLIDFVFGVDYRDSYVPLIILASGQVVNAFFGAADVVLEMTGHQKDSVRAFLIGAICNIAFNLALIPILGIVGAACATAASFLVWNILLWQAAHHRLGVKTGAFGLSWV